jgi:tetratricopeptide (TPR) repeat protein
MDEHVISRRVLDRFAHHTATAEEQRAVLRHLLTGCKGCQAYLGRTWAGFSSPEDNVVEISTSSYDSALERLGSLSTWAPDSLAALESHPPLRQELLIRNHSRYWRREICEELAKGAQEDRFTDSRSMRRKAKLAVWVSERLKPVSRKDETQIEDLRARAWTGLANTLRVAGDLNEAEGAFLRAQAHLEASRGELRSRARLLSQVASLRLDQRRFRSSRALIREATEIWRDLHNRGEVACCLLKEAITVGEGGDPLSGLRLLNEAEHMAQGVDPKLGTIIIQSRVRFLSDSRQTDAAVELYLETAPLFSPGTDPLIHIKLTWLKGQLLIAEGHFEPAAQILSSVQQYFLHHGNRSEAALVSLELAFALAKMGRRQEVQLLATAAFQEMVALRITREALAALILLRKSA